VLSRILAETRAEVARRRAQRPLEAARTHPRAQPRGFAEALRAPGIAVIAEFKRRSPSAGAIAAGAALAPTIEAYARGGASALSILTEGPNFGGSLEDLRAARELSQLPLLRKDFIVDDYQLQESAAAGADAVLLIVAALAREELASLHARALELGLDVLVEVHDRAELQIALELEAQLIGINNRDLRDFSVDISHTERLLGDVPAGVAVVSESGIAHPAQLRRLAERGVAAVLVGESLMRAGDPAVALRELLGVRATF
jgi:indole-3-glycerol phosphate synthase